MQSVLILYATFTGNTREAALYLFNTLPKNFPNLKCSLASIWEIKNSQELLTYDAIIFGSSTWGDGVNPDAERFLVEMARQNIDLSPVPIALFGLGDSAFEKFCGSIPDIKKNLEKFGAVLYSEIFTLDGYPTPEKLEPLQIWAKKFISIVQPQEK